MDAENRREYQRKWDAEHRSKRSQDPRRREYVLNYSRTKLKRFTVALSVESDKDVVSWLVSQPNTSGYIKALIKKDMDNSRLGMNGELGSTPTDIQ